MEVRLTVQAWEDLHSIWRHLADQSERTAESCIVRIMNRTDQLSQFPKSGPERKDIASGVRTLSVDRWLVLYQVLPSIVQIVRIVDGARDLNHLQIIGE